MNNTEFVKQYAQKVGCDEQTAKKQVQVFTQMILDSMKRGDSVTITNFGKFHIKERTNSTIFKFLPAQKFKAVLGWASEYKG